jgi:hypothetical protein
LRNIVYILELVFIFFENYGHILEIAYSIYVNNVSGLIMQYLKKNLKNSIKVAIFEPIERSNETFH